MKHYLIYSNILGYEHVHAYLYLYKGGVHKISGS